MIAWLKDHGLLVFILVVAAVMRFTGLAEADFHHDELSALLRAQFDNIWDVFQFGVVDNHPAFTQFLIWANFKRFGMSPLAVKWPFALAGVVSVFVIYKLGKALFNETSGLIAAALFASLQYGLIYAQWARPYSLGLLFVLLAFWCLVHYRQSQSVHHVLGYAILIALCGLTHYFALLQVIIIALFWWVGQSKRDKWRIMWASVLGALLFLPHFSKTLHHLSIGGIGEWLQKPEDDMWWQVLQFTFHYHWSIPAVLLLAIITSLKTLKGNQFQWLVRLVFVLGVILPFTIAYYYSVEINPLLHFGTALFGFPFLLLLIASLVAEIRKIRLAVIAIILILANMQVWIGRKHHVLNLKTAFNTPFEWSARMENSVPMLVDLRKDLLALLAEQGQIDTSQVIHAQDYDRQGSAELFNTISSDSIMVVVTPGSSNGILSSALLHYPKINEIRGFESGSAWLLAKSNEMFPSLDSFVFDKGYPVLNDSNPYSHALAAPVHLPQDKALLIEATYQSEQLNNAFLAVSILHNEQEVAKGGASEAAILSSLDSLQYMAWVIDGVDLAKFDSVDVKSYLWTQGSEAVRPKSIRYRLVASNPLKYKMFQPF